MRKTLSRKIKVAVIGTNGLPARYGGFETLVDNLTQELNEEFDFTVYCSKTPKKKRLQSYNKTRLIYLPFKANGYQSFIYDTISMFHAWFTSDILFILGPAAGIITPLNSLFRKKIILNHGGLNEWERKKFSRIERFYLRISHEIAAHWATYNIADNNILRESILQKFREDSIVIRYGGDHVMKVAINNQYILKYPFIKEKYAISVSRAQKDNNLHLILEAFESISNFKLVLISNWQVSKYGRDLKEKYSNYDNMILLDAIYESYELNMLRSNAILYIHSHSQCGTAPSLVEAICLGLPIISYDVPTNRETTKNKVLYFENGIELENHLTSWSEVKSDQMKNELQWLIQKEYTWKYIASQYRELFINGNSNQPKIA